MLFFPGIILLLPYTSYSLISHHLVTSWWHSHWVTWCLFSPADVTLIIVFIGGVFNQEHYLCDTPIFFSRNSITVLIILYFFVLPKRGTGPDAVWNVEWVLHSCWRETAFRRGLSTTKVFGKNLTHPTNDGFVAALVQTTFEVKW